MGRSCDRDLESFRLRVREWIRRNAPDGRPPSAGDAAEWERRLSGASLLCPAWPEDAGGSGLSALELLVLEEECAGAGVPRVDRGVGERVVGPTILVHGTAAQRAALLPRIRSGDDVYCLALSEPAHGSDLGAVETRGIVAGGDLVIAGEKTWASGAGRANVAAVLCRTDPRASGHRGLSYVLVRLDPDNGVDHRPVRQLTGSSGFGRLVFDGARVPLASVIGGLNGGWGPALTTLARLRSGDGAGHLAHERELWDLVREAREAGTDRDASVRLRLTWAYTRVALMRFSALRRAAAGADGADADAEAAMAQLLRAEYHRRFGEIALEIAGAAGMVRPDGPGYRTTRWQDVFLSSRGETIGPGTGEVLRTLIAERALGLPRDPEPSVTSAAEREAAASGARSGGTGQ